MIMIWMSSCIAQGVGFQGVSGTRTGFTHKKRAPPERGSSESSTRSGVAYRLSSSRLPPLKRKALEALIWIGAPVDGLGAIHAAGFLPENFPKLATGTCPPVFTPLWIE